MAFGWTAATWLAVGSGISAAVGLAGVVSSADAARSSSNSARDAAKATALATDEATNRANQKAPDSAAAMAANVMAGKAGQSGTMLTGAQGVAQSQLTLGKTTLLGG